MPLFNLGVMKVSGGAGVAWWSSAERVPATVRGCCAITNSAQQDERSLLGCIVQ